MCVSVLFLGDRQLVPPLLVWLLLKLRRTAAAAAAALCFVGLPGVRHRGSRNAPRVVPCVATWL